jgi:hypothetical protein
MITSRLVRNVAFLVFVAAAFLAAGGRAKAVWNVCDHEGCECAPSGFGWVAQCPYIANCELTYPNFCDDFMETCPCGFCQTGHYPCWSYCPGCFDRK